MVIILGDTGWRALATVVQCNGPVALQSYISSAVPGEEDSFEDRLKNLLIAKRPAILREKSRKWIRDIVFPGGDVGDFKTFDVAVWRYIIRHKELNILCNLAPVEELYQFRNELYHYGPRPLSDAEVYDLWNRLRNIFLNLRPPLKGELQGILFFDVLSFDMHY